MHDETWQWHSQSGRLLTLRPIAADDRARYAAYVARLSYGTRYFRYGHGNLRLTDAELDLVCRIDPTEGRRYVVVTTENGEDVIVATGCYFRNADRGSCDMSIVVADAWQGTHIAHRLMKILIERAIADGLQHMVAEVMATNLKMLRFTQRHGFTLVPGTEAGAVKLQRPLLQSSSNRGVIESAD